MPGVLDDISLTGCKVHYDAPVTLVMDADYEMHIRLSRFSQETLVLMCHPQWTKEKEDNSTEIGFLFLRSPDTVRLEEYVKKLQQESASSDFDLILPQEDSCQFV